MSDIYKDFAAKLDGFPNGFPATESGVELKILKKIFTPEEVEVALKLSPMPETVEAIAQRFGKAVPDTQATLDTMAKRGLVGFLKESGQELYMLMPFVIGLMESSTLHRMNREIAELFEQYAPYLSRGYGRFAPAEARVVPVSTQIPADLQVYRYEDLRRMIEEAKSFELLNCWCRQERAAVGHPCKHTVEICLQFSKEEGQYDKYPMGRKITKEEALQVMAKAEEEGLVHVSYNAEDGQVFCCNCCSCCCGLMRGLKEYKAPNIIAKSNFVASIDQESCAACGVCADERCPMNAIVEEDGNYRVQPERCIGCGVCAPTCPTESIKLVRRPEPEQDKPPTDLMQLYMDRAAKRGIEIKIE
jgi:electron transport complex protein RnfB